MMLKLDAPNPYLAYRRTLSMGGPLSRNIQYCKRCRAEYTGAQRTCPHCSFNPKQRGLRVSLGCFLIFILAMTGAQLSMAIYPPIGGYLLPVAGLGLVLAVVILGLAFLATPHRLGRLFLYA